MEIEWFRSQLWALLHRWAISRSNPISTRAALAKQEFERMVANIGNPPLVASQVHHGAGRFGANCAGAASPPPIGRSALSGTGDILASTFCVAGGQTIHDICGLLGIASLREESCIAPSPTCRPIGGKDLLQHPGRILLHLNFAPCFQGIVNG